ncbi:hypothetical protein J5295_04280 [Riemerella anatipestifer]|uniref:Uncharacterized protein n=2 Tax=Riemerella anatipestifer TaxID=34085 RepID=E4TAK6_RIEAD|nr:hypothetical protein [Riemerella anatipestifer]ADQ82366.1 hypothetical protein Riean_1206 [Riemerella anatipestifer ATCC 11845 = DSM 15868]AFD56368.1 hypothetical protein RA0C_1474 [Riemerella anatipestifer ATCC 11845 = DSM 15868]AGC39705.1 hypothetical protein G148_0400 [Riemerella anatipestifer RA-CH-2]AKP69566.1 hypothetical protein CG08_1338 [Riemerella anatipestifer]AKP71472.1 hypothetical protein CG09_1281 [Riemerella anatipestifer]
MKKILIAMSFVLGLSTAYSQQVQGSVTSKAQEKVIKKEQKMQSQKKDFKKEYSESAEKGKEGKEAFEKGEYKGKLKADGTPDRRYKENRKLKKDGTPDKRFKNRKNDKE